MDILAPLVTLSTLLHHTKAFLLYCQIQSCPLNGLCQRARTRCFSPNTLRYVRLQVKIVTCSRLNIIISDEILVERRCHAQTNLSVRPGLVNTSNATKSANLYDRFDYVHLRVPLPKDLTGSEIFSPANSTPIPESYFLMVRSSPPHQSSII